MSYTVGVPEETLSGERLVSLTPEVVGRLVKGGATVKVERGAGKGAFHSDGDYEAAGAQIVKRKEAFSCDVVTKVRPPDKKEIGLLEKGGVLIGFLSPLDQPETAQALAKQGVTALAMELVPRISRAQKMDALSALSGVAGYRAVLEAAIRLPKFFPLLTTAAGTVRPANVLVLGAGVAGLQAIATARRLGARVSGYDIRDVVREEIQSLGATFVELEIEMDAMQDSGGYAKALVAEKAKQQTKLLVPFIGKSDVVITTALIPGRAAPTLITREAVEAMAPGSVIVDLAAPNGGNCELTEPGKTVEEHGVTIVGSTNLPAEMPVHASQLYAKTLLAILQEFTGEDGFTPNFDDEVFAGACVTHDGEVVHERVKSILQSA
ncbi:MAG: Re/Si-specific NAD(P)(+) transhydrogenase subunit alpha [Rhodothermales bacterium]|nr:Re/Si-specific NAD(P)(+) transhydrogenase subunit alpha [Rhodothermales bacterium]MBO6781549.1 Re/Si-specific NAD(P)(+) transhydrogenase subunit alpha [Rhodothermales bacterium]